MHWHYAKSLFLFDEPLSPKKNEKANENFGFYNKTNKVFNTTQISGLSIYYI